MVCSYNPTTWRPGLVDGLRSGSLLVIGLCRSGVRTKLGVDMVVSAEARITRLSKEGWTGPGRRRSRPKSPRQAVVGSRLWIGSGWQPDQNSETQAFLILYYNISPHVKITISTLLSVIRNKLQNISLMALYITYSINLIETKESKPPYAVFLLWFSIRNVLSSKSAWYCSKDVT